MTVRPRRTWLALLTAAAVMISFWTQSACRPLPTVAINPPADHDVMIGYSIPQQVRRLAVWYPNTSEQEAAYGYSRLEQATFLLKKQRSWIKIVERRSMEPLNDEQRFQLSGRVGDDSAVRIGRWLGADSMVLFRIAVPTWRERLLARIHGKMPPLVVSSKIISVESGEVLYHDVVTAMPVPLSGEWGDFASDFELQPALRSALDQALSTAIAHLHQSFR